MSIYETLGDELKSQFRIGADVWYVHAFPIGHNLGPSAYTIKYTIMGYPYLTKYGWFVPAVPDHLVEFCKQCGIIPDPYVSAFSLRDCNVIPNDYNQHRLFLSEQEAEDYMSQFNNAT